MVNNFSVIGVIGDNHRHSLSSPNPNRALCLEDVQKNAPDGQTGRKTNRTTKLNRRSTYPLRQMRNLDGTKKRPEPTLKDILLFDKLYGKSGC